MADTKSPMNHSESSDKLRTEGSQSDNQTLRHEQAKGEVSGGSERGEKSAIGGSSSDPSAKTGEPGRARNELDSVEGRKEDVGQQR